MIKKTFSKEELQTMVAELESEFDSIMKSEQANTQLLAKSEEDSAKEEKKEEEKKPETEAKEDEKTEESAPAAEAKEEDKKEESKDEDHGYDDEDMEEMHKMYSSMSKAELKAHKESIEKCYKSEDMEKCGEMSMEKSEKTEEVVVVETKPETDLLKSENEVIKKENEELKKNIDGLISAMNTFFTKKAPSRKAITDIEFVKKSEENQEVKPLTKSEISSILSKKVQDPTLSKSDRDAINEFYLTNAGVEKISHLLKQ